jgi:hypothetical protein
MARTNFVTVRLDDESTARLDAPEAAALEPAARERGRSLRARAALLAGLVVLEARQQRRGHGAGLDAMPHKGTEVARHGGRGFV